jgi:hypothetical protein
MKEQKQIVIQFSTEKKSNKKSTEKKRAFEIIDVDKIAEFINEDLNSRTVKNNIDFYSHQIIENIIPVANKEEEVINNNVINIDNDDDEEEVINNNNIINIDNDEEDNNIINIENDKEGNNNMGNINNHENNNNAMDIENDYNNNNIESEGGDQDEIVVELERSETKIIKRRLFVVERVHRTPIKNAKTQQVVTKLREVFVNKDINKGEDLNMLGQKRHYTKLKSLENKKRITQTTLLGFLNN